jgi:hypothetical protein
MIGSAIPPRLVPIAPLGDTEPDMDPSPPVERQPPHLDVEIDLDESSFGLNGLSVETLQIQIRSPSLELECPDTIAAFDGSLQTIYHSMDDIPLVGGLAIAVAGSNATFLSPFESTSQVNVLPSPSPKLSFSLMPKLGPIILSELSSLGEADPSVPAQPSSSKTQTPVTPALSPAFSEEPSPVSTLNVLADTDEARASIDTEANVYFNHDSENDVLTVLNLDLGETPTDSMSASESDLYGKSSRVSNSTCWDRISPLSMLRLFVTTRSYSGILLIQVLHPRRSLKFSQVGTQSKGRLSRVHLCSPLSRRPISMPALKKYFALASIELMLRRIRTKPL